MSKIGDGIFWRGEKTCPWWLCFSFDNALRRIYQDPYRILGMLVRPGESALDVGPGMGYFTLPLAELVGPGGRVCALDIQPEMMDRLRRRIGRSGARNIETRLYDGSRFGLDCKFDFILLFWMFHEVRGKDLFLAELANVCKPGTRILLAEPFFHVTGKDFRSALAMFADNGLKSYETVKIALSRAVVFVM